MSTIAALISLATVLFALGMWLLLPRGRNTSRVPGMLLTVIALGIYGSQLPRLAYWGPDGGWTDDLEALVFWVLAAVSVVSAVAAVTVRSPVYCAIWFALMLLGTAGLFFYHGAQFLGVATVVVYAGAILVTFLFVLMLAQPGGQAYYDRISWEGLLSATTGAVLVGILTTTILGLNQDAGLEPARAELDAGVLHPEHVMHLGAELFSRHLLAVQVAGTLLLVALVGAVAIVAHERSMTEEGTVRPGVTVPGDRNYG